MKIFVDTDIIIDYLRTHSGALLDLLNLARDGQVRLYYSAVTVIELYTGESSAREEQIIEGLFEPMTIVNLDKDLAKKVGEIRQKTKKDVALGDLIIGTSAFSLDAQLATSNVKHFSKIPGLKFFKGKKKID